MRKFINFHRYLLRNKSFLQFVFHGYLTFSVKLMTSSISNIQFNLPSYRKIGIRSKLSATKYLRKCLQPGLRKICYNFQTSTVRINDTHVEVVCPTRVVQTAPHKQWRSRFRVDPRPALGQPSARYSSFAYGCLSTCINIYTN